MRFWKNMILSRMKSSTLLEKFNFYYGTHYGINLKGEHPIRPNQRVEYRFDPRVKSLFFR